MLSFFIVPHENETFFELNDNEWSEAVEVFPQLLNPESKLHYFERSASGWLETGKDNYVDTHKVCCVCIIRQYTVLNNLIVFALTKIISELSRIRKCRLKSM